MLIGVDPVSDTEGKWVEWPATGWKLKVARMRNQRYLDLEQELITEGLKKLERELHGQRPTQVQLRDMQRDIQIQCVAHTLLKGWEGIEEYAGTKPFEYSPENSYKILSDPAMVLLLNKVILEATEMSNFMWRSEAGVEQIKNS